MREICDVTQRKARKAHACDVCGKAILPGSEYIHARSVQDSRYWYNKLHIHCDAVLEAYAKQAGKGVDYERLYEVGDWLFDTACCKCPQEGACRLTGQDILSCKSALMRILPPTTLRAALESVKQNEE